MMVLNNNKTQPYSFLDTGSMLISLVNYSVLIVTVNVVREMLTLTFEAKESGKIHWVLYSNTFAN